MAYTKSGVPLRSEGLRRNRADMYSQDGNSMAIVPNASANGIGHGASFNYGVGFRSTRRRFPTNVRAPFCYVYGSSQRMAGMHPFYLAPVPAMRNRPNMALDRYPGFDTRHYGFPQFSPLVHANVQGEWRGRNQQGGNKSFRRRRPGRFLRRKSFPQTAFRDSAGNSRRGRRGGRFIKKVTEDSLNADLDAYMGSDSALQRLDNQLDAYFGRQGSSTLDQATSNPPDALNDPSDIAMDGGNLPCSGLKSRTSRVHSL